MSVTSPCSPLQNVSVSVSGSSSCASGRIASRSSPNARPRPDRFAGAHAAAWFMLVVALPLGDTVIVLRHGGTMTAAFGIHLATAAVVLVDAALLSGV